MLYKGKMLLYFYWEHNSLSQGCLCHDIAEILLKLALITNLSINPRMFGLDMFYCIISLYTTDYDFLQVLFLSTNTYTCTVKPVYKGHSKEPENVPFNEHLPSIHSDLVYRGVLELSLFSFCVFCPVFHVSLDCLFLIALSIFSNIYFK